MNGKIIMQFIVCHVLYNIPSLYEFFHLEKSFDV